MTRVIVSNPTAQLSEAMWLQWNRPFREWNHCTRQNLISIATNLNRSSGATRRQKKESGGNTENCSMSPSRFRKSEKRPYCAKNITLGETTDCFDRNTHTSWPAVATVFLSAYEAPHVSLKHGRSKSPFKYACTFGNFAKVSLKKAWV